MPYAIASLLEAQADTGAWAPAWAPSRRLTLPAVALAISIGMASGETRRGPLASCTSQLPIRVCSPPMPVAITTPSRSRSTGFSSFSPKPASRQASRAATTPSWAERSSRRASTRSSTVVGSTAADAAIWTDRSAAQSASILLMPERPASSPSQVLATSPPSGVVAPSPVTTMGVGLMGRTFRWSGVGLPGVVCRRCRAAGEGGR